MRLRGLRAGRASATALALSAALATPAWAGSGHVPADPSKAPTCFGRPATLVGTSGDDHLPGGRGVDVIIGRGGDDKINGKQKNDFICAGSGDDVVHGSEGLNKVNGGAGDDWLDARRGPGQHMYGGPGKDFIEAEGMLYGGPGDDLIESYGYLDSSRNPFRDITFGGPGNDTITAQNHWITDPAYPPQKLNGGPGNDIIGGGPDDDSLFGDDGNDALDGAGGDDRCEQGPGLGSVTRCESSDVKEGANVLLPSHRYRSLPYRRALGNDPSIAQGPPPRTLDVAP